MSNKKDELGYKIGQKIKSYRKSNHMTQEDMSFELGLTDASYYGRKERGLRMFTAHELVRICELFHITMDKLIKIDLGEDKVVDEYLDRMSYKLTKLNKEQQAKIERIVDRRIKYNKKLQKQSK